MRPLQAGDVLLVAAEHVRRPGEALEVSGAERRCLVGGSQRLERAQP